MARTDRKLTVAQIADQAARCYQLRLKGRTIRAIATEVGIAKSTAQDRLDSHIRDLVLPLADEVRLLELDRLDSWAARLEDRLDDGEAPERLIPVALKVQERRARLMGLDAPERADVTVHEVSEQDVELAALIREAKAANAVTEAGLRDAHPDR